MIYANNNGLHINLYFTEAENILLTTAQVDYKSISPKLFCVMERMFVPHPLNSYVEALKLNVMVLGDRTFER